MLFCALFISSINDVISVRAFLYKCVYVLSVSSILVCKIIHPCSLKELVSYMNKTIKYKNYLLGNLKYMMLVIDYMYLNFLNTKIGNEESKFDLNFIDLCTYVNLMNVAYYINDVKDSKSFIRGYFYYDTNN